MALPHFNAIGGAVPPQLAASVLWSLVGPSNLRLFPYHRQLGPQFTHTKAVLVAGMRPNNGYRCDENGIKKVTADRERVRREVLPYQKDAVPGA